MIFEPGRKTRLDVHASTSAIDVLPTLLHVTGHPDVDWTEGVVLPPYARVPSGNDRNIYALDAKKNNQYAPLRTATTTLRKGQYKLTYFFGYEELGVERERVELYDIENDPEEIRDIYNTKRETAAEMLNDIKTKLAEVNEPYL
jgi:arylsulfatase A-like enzyme